MVFFHAYYQVSGVMKNALTLPQYCLLYFFFPPFTCLLQFSVLSLDQVVHLILVSSSLCLLVRLQCLYDRYDSELPLIWTLASELCFSL